MQNVLKVGEDEQEHGKHRVFSDTGSNLRDYIFRYVLLDYIGMMLEVFSIH